MDGTQLLHDRVNLFRLVTRLEDDIRDRDSKWEKQGLQAWVKATMAQQNIGYARRLLKNIKDYDVYNAGTASPINDVERVLDRLEPVVDDEIKRLTPQPKARKSLLSDLPRPTPKSVLASLPTENTEVVPNDQTPMTSVPPPPPPTNVAKDLLLAPSEEPPAPASVNYLAESFSEKRPALRSEKPSSTAEARDSTSRFLTTSLATQEELSEKLARMAAQLKQNSVRFTDALAKDKAVMENAEEKLTGNLTMMQKQRTRLNLHSWKSGSTTWMVLGAIVVVMIAWIFTFLLIRVT